MQPIDEQLIGGLLIGLDLFGVGLDKLAALVARHAIPTMAPFDRAWLAAGIRRDLLDALAEAEF